MTKKLTYKESELITLFATEKLVELYFSGVNRKKVSPLEMLYECPKFINEIWEITVKKILKKED